MLPPTFAVVARWRSLLSSSEGDFQVFIGTDDADVFLHHGAQIFVDRIGILAVVLKRRQGRFKRRLRFHRH